MVKLDSLLRAIIDGCYFYKAEAFLLSKITVFFCYHQLNVSLACDLAFFTVYEKGLKIFYLGGYVLSFISSVHQCKPM